MRVIGALNVETDSTQSRKEIKNEQTRISIPKSSRVAGSRRGSCRAQRRTRIVDSGRDDPTDRAVVRSLDSGRLCAEDGIT